MQSDNPTDDADFVRCLECGTVYRQPRANRESRACPTCGYVGWTTVIVEERKQQAGK